MTRTTRLAMAFALGAALATAGAALAQTHSAPSPPASAQPAPPSHPTPPWDQTAPTAIKPADPNTVQPTYGVDPPPEGQSGVYLPAAVLGYAKSAAGCVVVGCQDGPKASGAPAPSTSGPPAPDAPASGSPSPGSPLPPSQSPEPPPANPGSPDTR